VPRSTTEEAAEVLVVAGVFWASRLISLIPPGWKQRNGVPARRIMTLRLWRSRSQCCSTALAFGASLTRSMKTLSGIVFGSAASHHPP